MTHVELGATALWLMLLLGAYHGVNPGMGWLFAVALGMQERKGSAVARALVPIALGHALAIGSVVLAAAFLGMALSREAIRYFTEYLERHPEDLGIRWLLNLAYMTLGEYPDHVPAAYLIPLEPFQSQFEGGTGLGLAIVYQIVQAHEGKVWARSKLGEGSVFVLRLRRFAVTGGVAVLTELAAAKPLDSRRKTDPFGSQPQRIRRLISKRGEKQGA